MTKKNDEKEMIIACIEDDSRNGVAFDDDIVLVLKKLTTADLFLMAKAFHQSFDYGMKAKAED